MGGLGQAMPHPREYETGSGSELFAIPKRRNNTDRAVGIEPFWQACPKLRQERIGQFIENLLTFSPSPSLPRATTELIPVSILHACS